MCVRYKKFTRLILCSQVRIALLHFLRENNKRTKNKRKHVKPLNVPEKKEKQNAHSCFLFIYRLI